MPTGAAHIPDDGTGMARTLRDLNGRLQRLEAASRIGAAASIPATDLVLASGWSAAGGTWASPQIRAQIDGWAQLAGSIVPGTLTVGTVIAMLPYAPPGDIEVRVGGGAATTSADLVVLASGALTIQNTAGTVTRIGLGALRFPLA